MGENDLWEVDDWEEGVGPGPPPTNFPPPPPRPPYLEDHVPADGLTTCDLCTWARLQLPPPPRLDAPLEAEIDSTLSWTLTLVIVSLLSALLGAIIMVTLLNCRRPSDRGAQPSPDNIWCLGRRRRRRTSGSGDEDSGARGDRSKSAAFQMRSSDGEQRRASSGVWSWMSGRSAPVRPAAIVPAIAPVANHYTLDEAYTAVEEALYAELDRPAYQNTAYTGDDPASSAPSSAYYSDLSASDRTYEVPAQTWEMVQVPPPRPRTTAPRLAAITETVTVPSDYV
ncbi:uncharacterized protein LOC111052918 isoform X2 [Nilaparvata lugens]|uniref:uncharacterized protein LOC111052918 isoform X2 n=1 Tax=Nilaparvata lugens TaxID=108931 RepID=UPI00193D19BD|nr:uncharacterized protein LOC111052918 isoform X2 [Nilaparvata lugens]